MENNATSYQLYVDNDGNLFTGDYKETSDTRYSYEFPIEMGEDMVRIDYCISTLTGSVINGRPTGKWVKEVKNYDKNDKLKSTERYETEYEIIANSYYVKSSKSYLGDKLVSEEEYLPVYNLNDRLATYTDVLKYSYFCSRSDKKPYKKTDNYYYNESGMKYIDYSIIESDGYITKEETTWVSQNNPIKYGRESFEKTAHQLNTITEDGKKVCECSTHYVKRERNNGYYYEVIVDSLELYYDNGHKMIIGDRCPDDETSFMVTMFERDGETVKKKGIVAMKDVGDCYFYNYLLVSENGPYDSVADKIKKLLD